MMVCLCCNSHPLSQELHYTFLGQADRTKNMNAAQVAQAALLRQARCIVGGSPLSEEEEPPSPTLHATSDSNDSQEDVTHEPSKKRKHTYYLRKDEKALLEKELEELQEKMRELEATPHITAKNELDKSIALNTLLSANVEDTNMALSGAQSMISAEMVSRFRNPLDHYVYMPEDAGLRKQSLMALKAMKLDTATRLIRERMRYMDIRQAHRHSECTVLKNGDYLISKFDVTPFEGWTDVRFVYDEFVTFITSQEVTISDHLGILAFRESEDCAESSATQSRVLSSIAPGLEIETNAAVFTKFVESTDGVTPSYGIGTIDYVDKDELHPYQSSTRLRKDITASVYLTQTFPDRSAEASAVSDSQPGTTLVRCATIRLHCPQFAISKEMERLARANAENWSDVMPQALLQRLGLY